MKSRTTAALLAFLLGGIGVHHFYLGKTAAGVLSILFFWTLIPSIVAFVNVIQYLVMSDDEFNRKYNSGAVSAMQTATVDTAGKLSQLYDLYQKGGISQQEYEAQKAKLL